MSESQRTTGYVSLETLAQIDPDALNGATSARFSFKYIDISCASNGRLTLPSDFVEFADAPSRARKMLKNGDVIVSTVRPNLKAFAYCRLDGDPYIASTGFAVLRARKNVDAHFLLAALLSDDISKQIESYAVGSNYPAINSSDVRRLQISAFSPGAQRAIGRVVVAIDNAIERTESLIGKCRKIRAGLIHDLFTRGLLPSGQLRPTREQAPALYQETAIGWIPREWTPLSLRSLVGAENIINGPFGSDLLTSELKAEGVPVLYVQDIKAGLFSRVSNAHITERKANELAFCNVRRGDVLVAKVGDPPCECCVYERDERAVVTQDVIRVRPPTEVSSSYLAALLNSSFGRKVVKKISIEGTRERVSLTEFKGLLFPIATGDEQLLIAERVNVLQAVISAESNKLAKLKRQKLGLVQDLLTGKVRVQVEEPDTEAVNA